MILCRRLVFRLVVWVTGLGNFGSRFSCAGIPVHDWQIVYAERAGHAGQVRHVIGWRKTFWMGIF